MYGGSEPQDRQLSHDRGNTPGVGAVLHAQGLRYVPEAHCHLRMGSVRIDITAPPKSTEASGTFVIGEVIIPPQVDEYKSAFDRECLCRWLVRSELASCFTL